MNKSFKYLVFAFVLVCICRESADAASIGLNIQGGGNATDGTISTATSIGVTGVYQQTNWNNFMPSQETGSPGVKQTYTGPFVDNAGNPTGLQLVWTGGGAVNNWTNGHGGDPLDPAPDDSGLRTGTTAAPGNLFTGYAYTNGAPESFRFSGVPYSEYDLIVYAGKGSADVLTVVGASTFDANGLPTDGTSTNHGTIAAQYLAAWTQAVPNGAAGNYFVITGLTGSDFILSLPTTTGSFEINAFQFVEVSAIPEPASMAMFGMAFCGLLAWRRVAAKRI